LLGPGTKTELGWTRSGSTAVGSGVGHAVVRGDGLVVVAAPFGPDVPAGERGDPAAEPDRPAGSAAVSWHAPVSSMATTTAAPSLATRTAVLVVPPVVPPPGPSVTAASLRRCAYLLPCLHLPGLAGSRL